DDLADHTLVAVTASHLVAGLDLPLHRDENLDHLHDAGRQLVATLQLIDLVDEALLETLLGFLILATNRLGLGHRLLVLERDLPPMATRDLIKKRLGDLCVLLDVLRALRNALVNHHVLETAVNVAVKDRELFAPVFASR